MKLRAPSGCASICHDGQIFIVEANGSIEVADAMAVTLAAHGFTPWEEGVAMPSAPESTEAADSRETDAQALDIDTLDRAGLFAFLRAHGARGSRNDTNAQLRAVARHVLEAQTPRCGHARA